MINQKKNQFQKWLKLTETNVIFVKELNDAIHIKNLSYLLAAQDAIEMVSLINLPKFIESYSNPKLNRISVHPTCLKMSSRMVRRINEYAWHCNDCQICIKCRTSDNEDKMMHCDQCDRSYHIYCIGLRKVPIGKLLL